MPEPEAPSTTVISPLKISRLTPAQDRHLDFAHDKGFFYFFEPDFRPAPDFCHLQLPLHEKGQPGLLTCRCRG